MSLLDRRFAANFMISIKAKLILNLFYSRVKLKIEKALVRLYAYVTGARVCTCVLYVHLY